MRIQLSDHFSYGKLLRFTLSTILMLICTSMYSIVDGFFVSNYVGKTAFAAVNLIYPVSMGVTAIGFMLGTGGSAIVSKTLGQGDRQLANRYFSLIIYIAIGAGAVLLPGVHIGDNSVIGAGSIVTKDVPANVVALGNPCRVLREISDRDREYYYKELKIDIR